MRLRLACRDGSAHGDRGSRRSCMAETYLPELSRLREGLGWPETAAGRLPGAALKRARYDEAAVPASFSRRSASSSWMRRLSFLPIG